MYWRTFRALALLGSTGAGSGLGVVVPLTVKYSRDGNNLEIFNLVSDEDEKVIRSKRGVRDGQLPEYMNNAYSNISSVNRSLKKHFDKNKERIKTAYKGLNDLIEGHFSKDTNNEEWGEVNEKLSNIKKTHEEITNLYKRLKSRDKQISAELKKLKDVVEDIEKTQDNVVKWQKNYSKKNLLPTIDKLIGLSKSLNNKDN